LLSAVGRCGIVLCFRLARRGWIDKRIKAKNRPQERVRAMVEHSIGIVTRRCDMQDWSNT